MGFYNDNSVGLSIEPIWLETTLDTRPLAPAPAPAPKPTRSNLRIGVSVLMLALLVGWLAVGWAQPSADDLVERGWSAYRAGSYRAASVALAEARVADSEVDTLGDLDRAITVGPMLDEIEKLIEGGQLARAEAHLASAVARAPRDRRTIITQQLLVAAQGAMARRATQGAPARGPQKIAPSQKTAALSAATPKAQASESAAYGASHTVASAIARGETETAPVVVAAAVSRARPQPVRGGVRILSDAPALVFVDGVLMPNEAPTTLRLPVGEHTIELRVPGTGRVLARRTVDVRARRNFVLRLQPGPEAPAVKAAPSSGAQLRAGLGRGASQ